MTITILAGLIVKTYCDNCLAQHTDYDCIMNQEVMMKSSHHNYITRAQFEQFECSACICVQVLSNTARQFVATGHKFIQIYE